MPSWNGDYSIFFELGINSKTGSSMGETLPDCSRLRRYVYWYEGWEDVRYCR